MSSRRQSLIPVANTSTLSKSRRSSPITTPNASPTKQTLSPQFSSSGGHLAPTRTSPSRLPIPISTSMTSTTLKNEDYLAALQHHLDLDVDSERASLSNINKQLEERIHQFSELCATLRKLHSTVSKIEAEIEEYELGLPFQQGTLQREEAKVEEEINNVNDAIEKEKVKITEIWKHREEQLIESLKEVTKDAEVDDEETVQKRKSRLQDLNSQKAQLIEEIEIAKERMQSEMTEYRKTFEDEKCKVKLNLEKERNDLENRLSLLENQRSLVKENHQSITLKLTEAESQITILKEQIESKTGKIKECNFKIIDLETLITHLKSDLQNASTLCNQFENNEYATGKRTWEEARERLRVEKYKRMKIEIQIREMSGIPTIIIISNSRNAKLTSTSLVEFMKHEDHDWKLEFFTALEAALDGVSMCLVVCDDEHEMPQPTLENEITEHLQKVSKSDRFSAFQTSFQTLSNSEIKDVVKLPTDQANLALTAVQTTMHNSAADTSRRSVVILARISEAQSLEDITNLTEMMTCMIFAGNVSSEWENSLQKLSSIKPVKVRKGYSFMNE